METQGKRGHAEAIFSLGVLYEFGGKGVSADYAKALEYYQKAANAGHETAPEKIKDVREKIKDIRKKRWKLF